MKVEPLQFSERRVYTGGVGPGFQPAAGLLPGVVPVNKWVSDGPHSAG